MAHTQRPTPEEGSASPPLPSPPRQANAPCCVNPHRPIQLASDLRARAGAQTREAEHPQIYDADQTNRGDQNHLTRRGRRRRRRRDGSSKQNRRSGTPPPPRANQPQVSPLTFSPAGATAAAAAAERGWSTCIGSAAAPPPVGWGPPGSVAMGGANGAASSLSLLLLLGFSLLSSPLLSSLSSARRLAWLGLARRP